LLLCALLVCVREGRAAGPLPENRGDPITTSDYSVDLFQGPTLASSRITALGGAYTGLAEGAEGIPFNPAAASLRYPQSTTNVDWDLTAGFTTPTSVRGTDFDNNGDSTFGKGQKEFYFGNLGGFIQWGHVGLGIMVSAQQYGIAQTPFLKIVQQAPTGSTDKEVAKGTDLVDVRFFKIDPVVSYGFLDDQLHVGGGIRAIYLQFAGALADVDPQNNTLGSTRQATDLYTNYAIGLQGGILWAPYKLPLRLGGAVRSPLAAREGDFGGGFKADDSGDIRAGPVYLPKRADVPWEVEVGASVQLWQRPLNIQWNDEDAVPVPDTERYRETKDGQLEPPFKGARKILKQRYRAIPRQKILITTSAMLSGPVANAVGVESMLIGRLERSGQDASLSIRGGVEAEVIPWWLVVRAGSYLEPSRFRHSSSRLHATTGFQVRLFKWDAFGVADKQTIWRLSGAVDFARDYFAWAVGLGIFM
jgi:hypothetical protein